MAPRTQEHPSTLHRQREHVNRFLRALRALGNGEEIADPAAQVWLEGRADEVILFVDDVFEAWLRCEITTDVAADAIDEYLKGLHVTMEPWVGKWYAPTCCGPLGSSPDLDEHEPHARHAHHATDAHHAPAPASERRIRAFDTLADTFVDAPALDVTEEQMALAV